MKFTLSPAAAADIERLQSFLMNFGPSAADRAVVALDNAVRSLEIFPERGRPSGVPRVRELIVPFGRSSYILRYAYIPAAGEIVVLRIWHGREQR